MPFSDTMTQIIMLVLAVATAVGNVLAWGNRMQMAATKQEMRSDLSAMELRLSEKISGYYVPWQAHNALSARMDRIEDECGLRHEARRS